MELAAFGLQHTHYHIVDAIDLEPLADRGHVRKDRFGQAVAQHTHVARAIHIHFQQEPTFL